jgi:hypothetical protein
LTLLEEATELDEALTLLLDAGAFTAGDFSAGAGAAATLLELGAAWTAALDWAASASASNSAKRSRGWAKDWATKTLATQAINE